MSPVATPTRAAEVVQTIGALPAMPHVAAKVFELLDTETCTADQLQKTIEADAALTAAVLRLVNSAMFSLPEPIGTLSHAVMLIGFHRLRSLAVAAVVAGLKRKVPAAAEPIRDGIWEHSVNVALGARLIAERQGLDSPEQAFVAGLLHDCGRLVLLANVGDQYAPLFANGAVPSSNDENDALGLDHQETGAALLEQWHFPPLLAGICAGHHADDYPPGREGALYAAVALADRLLNEESGDDPIPPARHLRMPASHLADLAEELRSRILTMRQELIAL